MQIGTTQPKEQKEQRKQSPPRNITNRAGKQIWKDKHQPWAHEQRFTGNEVNSVDKSVQKQPARCSSIQSSTYESTLTDPVTWDAVQWQRCHAHNTNEPVLPEYLEVRAGTRMTLAIQAQTGSANVPILPVPSCHRYPASSEGKCQIGAHESKWPEALDCVPEYWQIPTQPQDVL